MITFYTNPQSRGRLVRWMLEEVSAPYETVVLGYGAGMKTPEYLAINPMGKVPAIVSDGEVVTECAAICAFLADRFPDAGMAPPPDRRAAYYRWLFFGAGPLEAAVTNQALGVTVPSDKAGFVGYGSLDAVLDSLEQALRAAPYLAGEKLSAADVYTGAQIGWGMRFGTIEARPVFKDYWERLSNRRAYLRACERDDALAAAS